MVSRFTVVGEWLRRARGLPAQPGWLDLVAGILLGVAWAPLLVLGTAGRRPGLAVTFGALVVGAVGGIALRRRSPVLPTGPAPAVEKAGLQLPGRVGSGVPSVPAVKRFGRLPGRITPQQLREALDRQKTTWESLCGAVVSLGFVRDDEPLTPDSALYGLPSIDLERFEIDPELIRIIPREAAQKYEMLPLARSGVTLVVAVADPTNVLAVDDVRFMTGYTIEPVVASRLVLLSEIKRHYPVARPPVLRLRLDPPHSAEGAPVLPAEQIVWIILCDSIGCGASEIQMRRRGNVGCVSYRLKGRLREAGRFPGAFYDRVVGLLRLWTGLALADRRQVQERAIRVPVADGCAVGFALSIAPGDGSPDVVLCRTHTEGDLSRVDPPDLRDAGLFKTIGSFRLRPIRRM